MPPSAFQSVLWLGMLLHSQCLSDIMRGSRLPPILLTAQTLQCAHKPTSPDDKVPLSLKTEAHGSQHALPSARHLPGLAQTQPGKPHHYSL